MGGTINLIRGIAISSIGGDKGWEKFNFDGLAVLSKKIKISYPLTDPTVKHPTQENLPIFYMFIEFHPNIIRFLIKQAHFGVCIV